MSVSPYGEHWRNLRQISSLEIFSTNHLNLFLGIWEEEIKYLLCKLFGNSLEDEFKVVELELMLLDGVGLEEVAYTTLTEPRSLGMLLWQVRKNKTCISKLWHMRLGHAGEKALQTLVNQGVLKGATTGLRKEFWVEALNYAVHLMNHLPISGNGGKNSLEKIENNDEASTQVEKVVSKRAMENNDDASGEGIKGYRFDDMIAYVFPMIDGVSDCYKDVIGLARGYE
ncbi:Cytochrome P450 81F2, partial [Cucurbita argyrosperma subsp. argyrosperma]